MTDELQRPTLVSFETRVRITDNLLPQVEAWLDTRNLSVGVGRIYEALFAAISVQWPYNSFTICSVLQQPPYAWPVDGTLVALIEKQIRRVHLINAGITKEWVLKTGIRFPAKEGQYVKFKHRVGPVSETHTGFVKAVDGGTARGFVEVEIAGTTVLRRIDAEDVINTITVPTPLQIEAVDDLSAS